MQNNYMPNVAKAQSLVKAAMSELDSLILGTAGEKQLQAWRAGSYLLETIAALLIRAPRVPCRLDFVADPAADLAAGSLQPVYSTPRTFGGNDGNGQMRVNVYLDSSEFEQARKLGCGNLSEGIKKALQEQTRTLN